MLVYGTLPVIVSISWLQVAGDPFNAKLCSCKRSSRSATVYCVSLAAPTACKRARSDQPVGMAESDDIKSAIATLKESCETAPACAVKIDSIHTHTLPIHGK